MGELMAYRHWIIWADIEESAWVTYKIYCWHRAARIKVTELAEGGHHGCAGSIHRKDMGSGVVLLLPSSDACSSRVSARPECLRSQVRSAVASHPWRLAGGRTWLFQQGER